MRDAILFLDDSPERAALAYERTLEDDKDHVIWCLTASEAIEVLHNYATRLKKVYMDHDLGGDEVTHPGNDNSGMAVVRYLEHAEPRLYASCEFIVHTYNEYAAGKMVERLSKAGYNVTYHPFGTGKL